MLYTSLKMRRNGTALLLLLVAGITGCSKSYDPQVNPLDQNVTYITGNQGTANWKLVSMVVGGEAQNLTTARIEYQKKYNLNGTFTDSDGMTGKWCFVSKDSLVEKFTSYTSGIYVTQGYKVSGINNSRLSLDYQVNTKHVCTTYALVP